MIRASTFPSLSFHGRRIINVGSAAPAGWLAQRMTLFIPCFADSNSKLSHRTSYPLPSLGPDSRDAEDKEFKQTVSAVSALSLSCPVLSFTLFSSLERSGGRRRAGEGRRMENWRLFVAFSQLFSGNERDFFLVRGRPRRPRPSVLL